MTTLLPSPEPERNKTEAARGPFRITACRRVYDNPWITLNEYQVITPADTAGLYGCITHKTRCAAVLAIDPQGCLLLVRQFFFPMGRELITIVCGGAPEGEDIAQAAARELAEETGLDATHWQHLEDYTASNGVSDKQGSIFLAHGLVPHAGDAQPDAEEKLEILRVPLARAFAMVEAGEITDLVSRQAITRLHVMSLKGALPSL